MKVILIGQLSDVYHKSFVGNDNSTIEYDRVEIYDPNAFNDSNRHFSIGILSDVVKKMDLLNPKVLNTMKGNEFEFLCDGMPDKYGSFKLKVISLLPYKSS